MNNKNTPTFDKRNEERSDDMQEREKDENIKFGTKCQSRQQG
jgi:hypothetical protein